MLRNVLIFVVGAAMAVGCADESKTRTPEASHYISHFILTDKRNVPLPMLMVVQGAERPILRLEYQPTRDLPKTLDKRRVLPADQWEVALWVAEDLDRQPPSQFYRFQHYPTIKIENFASVTSTTTGQDGEIISSAKETPPVPPTPMAVDRIYRYTCLSLKLPEGRYQARVIVFPSADPPPAPGLMALSQKLGTPVVLHEFQLEFRNAR